MPSPDWLFDVEPAQKRAAIELYEEIKDLPILSPHGHVDPALFSAPERRFGNPAELFIQADHYVTRMLYSQGIPYDQLLARENPRDVWRSFAGRQYLFLGTPCGTWLAYELENVFGITEKLGEENADAIYDRLQAALDSPEFSPRALFERFKVQVLATTDAAAGRLEHHQAIRDSDWRGKVIPTFRPDEVTNLYAPGWRQKIVALSQVSGVEILDYRSYLAALEERRAAFRRLGATATDCDAATPDTTPLEGNSAAAIFQRALRGQAAPADVSRFSANMLYEMARMSAEDGLVMQIHTGVYRNHSTQVFSQFGADRGFDLPVWAEFTRNLRPLLERFGHHPNFRLILFTLDESTYARELAPLASAYPAIKLGPPWWFHDSWNGMRRYFDQVMETAGMYNTAGFNDDTRSFITIPARHDVWRRAAANWLAGLLVRQVIDRTDARSMAADLAVGLARTAYRLG